MNQPVLNLNTYLESNYSFIENKTNTILLKMFNQTIRVNRSVFSNYVENVMLKSRAFSLVALKEQVLFEPF